MQCWERFGIRLLLIISPCMLAVTLALYPPLGAHAADILITNYGGLYPCNEQGLKSAVADAGSGTITFDCDVTTITLTTPALIPGVQLTIDGSNPGGTPMTLSGGNTTSIFSVTVSAQLTLMNIILANGNTASGGGAIKNGGWLVISGSTFTNNRAHLSNGGAIDNDGTALISNTIFSGNATTGIGSGGAINSDGVVTVTGGTFSNNASNAHGAAI